MSQKEKLLQLLKTHYHFTSFRPGQEEAIDNILEKKDTLVIMPTGGGKSLCYQLPSLVLEGLTLVISPLIALMKDQVDNLNKIGIKATFINSSISLDEATQRLEAAAAGVYKLVYIAPERFYNSDFIKYLTDLKVSLLAVDEAHCISQWGHDFRPSYRRLGEAAEACGRPPIIALTATATPEVREDIIKQLNLKNYQSIITGFARPNLQFGVIEASDNQKPKIVLDVIQSLGDNASGIIYVGTRAKADGLLEILLAEGIEAVGYHAGLTAEERKWVQDNFMKGKAQVIVATNAFGMGIDKSDIRFVVHYDLPGTIEAYYQEAGRAGRDGEPSVCLLLYHPRDRYLREFFIRGDNPTPNLICQVYKYLLSLETDNILITYAEIKEAIDDEYPEMAIGTSIKILEQAGVIRRAREKNGQAFIKILGSQEEINNSFSNRASKQHAAFDKIVAKFGSDLINGLETNLEAMALLLDLPKETILRVLKKLASHNLLEYKPPFKGTEIQIIKRLDPYNLELDTKALKAKAARAYAKLDMMEEYVFTNFCRQRYLLDYFGDDELKRCNKCDICLKGERVAEILTTTQYKKDNKLSTKLTQLETFDLLIQGLSLTEVAKRRGLDEEAIINHIAFLMDKGLEIDLNKIAPKKERDKIEKKIKQKRKIKNPVK